MEFPRSKREQLVRATVGPNWSDETSTDPSRPVNLLDLYGKVVVPNLAPQNPRVLLSTWDQESKPAVAAMEHVINLQIPKIEFAETMQRVAYDALLSMGIVMVGLGSPADAAYNAWESEAGQYFVELVDLDDFLYDYHARRFSQAAFIGNRFRRPLKAVQADKTYSKKRKDLIGQDIRRFNPEGDQRINVLQSGNRVGTHAEAEDMVELIQVYLPRERMMVVYATDDSGRATVDEDGQPLRKRRFIGPPCGPYHFLSYGVVPNSAMGKGPMQNLQKLDDVVNRLFCKLINQAQDQKKVVCVTGQADADGNRILACNDGQIIRVDDAKSITTLEFNGPDPMNFQLAESLRQLFGYMAGNLDTLGGLSPGAKTASADKMLNENASRMVLDMQAKTVAFAAKVLGSMAWYEWEHPQNVRSYEHKVPGLNIGMARHVYPRDAEDKSGNPRMLRRQIPYAQLDLRVDPYSTPVQTPQMRLQQMNGVVTQIVIPMMQIMAAQGITFDMNAYLKKVGEYMDMPDLAEILTIQEPVPMGQGGDGGGPKAPSEDKTYTRENIPMRSEKGASQQLLAKLSGVKTGGNPNEGQAA